MSIIGITLRTGTAQALLNSGKPQAPAEAPCETGLPLTLLCLCSVSSSLGGKQSSGEMETVRFLSSGRTLPGQLGKGML